MEKVADPSACSQILESQNLISMRTSVPAWMTLSTMEVVDARGPAPASSDCISPKLQPPSYTQLAIVGHAREPPPPYTSYTGNIA